VRFRSSRLRNGADPIQATREAEAAARIEAEGIAFEHAATRFIKANRAAWKNVKPAADPEA
jgi:hypothetical protein